MALKHCNGCDKDKELSEFYFHKSGILIGKPYPKCKHCNSVITSTWRKNNSKTYKSTIHTWRKENSEKVRETNRNSYYKRGGNSASKNRLCAAYLGVIVSETVLSREFPGFKRMPYGNPGYDYECPKGFKIDVKSACIQQCKTKNGRWQFTINNNKVANFFLCIAWTDRQSLIPKYLWMIPGKLINEKKSLSITNSLKCIRKWSQYERPLDNVLSCCNKIKGYQ